MRRSARAELSPAGLRIGKKIAFGPSTSLCIALLVLSFGTALSGCDQYELIRKQDVQSRGENTAELHQQIAELREEIEQLRGRPPAADKTPTESAARREERTPEVTNGRYQLVAQTTGNRSLYLLDTKVGVAWVLTPNYKLKKDLFIPIEFQGGFSVPALENQNGDLVTAEHEAEAIRSLAAAHEYVKKVTTDLGDAEAAGATAVTEATSPDDGAETPNRTNEREADSGARRTSRARFAQPHRPGTR